MLVTKRMERLGFGPLGYLATDYVLATWSAFEPTDVEQLFEEDILGEELEEWMAESSMLRRTFRNIATIAGLLEKNHPGQEKRGRQMTMNADLIYDVLRKHEPDHVLLRATRQEAAGGLTDVRPHRPGAGPRQGPHHAHGARPRLAAGGAGADRGRPRMGRRRRRGCAAGRGRSRWSTT